MKDPKSYDFLSLIVILLGLHEGLEPFAAKLLGWRPSLCLPLWLPAPAWWLVSGVVTVVAFALLVVIDNAKKRHTGED